MNRFYLWYSGFSDIPELMALDPAEAMKIVTAAEQAERDATFWDQTSTRNMVRFFYGVLIAAVLIAAVVMTGLGPIVRALMAIAVLFVRPYMHRKNMSRLRPRIYEALRTAPATPRTGG